MKSCRALKDNTQLKHCNNVPGHILALFEAKFKNANARQQINSKFSRTLVIASSLLTACITSASPERAVQKATGGYFCLGAFRKKKKKLC